MLSCMPVDSATAPLRSGIESDAHVRNGSQWPRATLGREVHAVQEASEARAGAQGLSQLCVLRLGFLQDGNIRVGVFPDGEEFLIGSAGLGAGDLL